LCDYFAVERVSETDDLDDAREKRQEYLENGLRLGWLIIPKLVQVEIYRPNQAVEILQSPTTLSGEDVLPGFVSDLQPIFSE
jgi:Uma2 family endonuclease